jgi:hypothetical protein
VSAPLDELRRKLQRLPEVGAKLAPLVAAEWTRLAQQAFSAGESVDGVPFTGRSGAIDLHKSGALGSVATRYSAVGTKVRASVEAVRYARFQLKHGFLPRAIPGRWVAAADAIVTRELERMAQR